MQRFYLPSFSFTDQKLSVQDDRILFQAFKVLRMKPGSRFHVFNETGEWLVQVESIDRKKLIVCQHSAIHNEAEARLKVSLYQGVPKKPAVFELIVQKATELGVTDIYPLITGRTENRRLTKIDRLKMIALEATEQCGRLHVPTVHYPVSFEEAIPTLNQGFIAYEYEKEKFITDYQKEIQGIDSIQIVIGPEGGLAEPEISLAKESGLRSFSLGKRILRTETAAIAALSHVLIQS